jgi:hypothetical protein
LQLLASLPPSALVQPTKTQAADVPAKGDAAPHNYDHIFIMEKLDRFIENPFDGEVSAPPVPSEVIEHASVLVNDLHEAAVQINALTVERDELDGQMKAIASKFVINELEVSYQELNKMISMLQNKRLRFHSDLDQMVQKICTDHQAKTTRYTELVQGDIDQTAQQIKKRKK